MRWFGLDAVTTQQRFIDAGQAPHWLSARQSIIRGTWGFTCVSVAGFAPWALFGRVLGRALGEAGLYAVCAVVFIGLSGLLLHPLIAGPGSLKRFYGLFSLAFTAYAIAWTVGWMTLRGHLGSWVGLGAGTAVMAWILAQAFATTEQWWRAFLVLFATNALGYFVGGWVEGAVSHLPAGTLSRSTQVQVAMLLWGVFYGLGLGAGLGWVFYACQHELRKRLTAAPGAA